MAIQVRRGNEADFDANKMVPGEWAVSLDTKYVRMCFAPGIVLRMASYEAFEADMELIQGILEECEEIQTAIERIKSEIDEKASMTIEYSNSASLSATRASEEADRAHEEAERAKNYADSAQSSTNVKIATKDTAGIIKGGDNYIAEDGTLTLITKTTETTLNNSCEGRLLFKEIRGKTEKLTSTGKNVMPINDVTFTGTKQLTFENPIPAGTYTMSAEAVSSDTYSPKCRAVFYSDSVEIGSVYLTRGIRSGGTITVESEITSVVLCASENYNDSQGDTATWSNIQIEVGSTMTAYEPYGVGTPFIRSVEISGIKTHDDNGTESSFTFSKPIELNEIGNVLDVIVDGKPIRRIGKVRVSGDWAWNKHASADGTNSYYTYQSFGQAIVPDGANGTFTHFTRGVLTENNRGFIGSDTVQIRFDEKASVDELKTWLNSNEVYAYYELATPITEALPTADQVAFNSIESFDGTTYLEIDSPLQPEFIAEYGTSKVGGVALESLLVARNNEIRISALETSAVNNI